MRILLIPAAYAPHYGGLETVVQNIASLSQNEGHAVEVITARYPRSLPPHEVLNGIPVTRLYFIYPQIKYLKQKKYATFALSPFLFFISLLRLVFFIRQFKPDIVNIQYAGTQSLFCLCAWFLLHFRMIVSFHGGDVDGLPHESALNRWLFRQLVQNAKAVTACSQTLLDAALTLEPAADAKSRVIYNGVDALKFVRAQPYQYETDYLFAVGKLAPHKGFDLLIDAFAQLGAAFPETHLIIGGTGDLMPQLSDQIRKTGQDGKIHLLGKLSQQQVAEMMAGARVIVIPSRREPFGIVGLEALASGRPIVCAFVGGLREILSAADVRWFEANDPESLKHALLETMSAKAQSPTDTQNQELACRFTWAKTANDYLLVYQQATA